MLKYLSLIFLLIAFGCKETPTQETESKATRDYQIELEDGIYVEVFDSTNVDENRYTLNNEVFKEGAAFTYQFYHLTTDGEKKKFQARSRRERLYKSLAISGY